MRIITTALVFMSLNACSAGQVAVELDQMSDLWQRQQPAVYSYEVTLDCFCPEELRGPFQVDVRNETTTVTRRGSSVDPSNLPVDPNITSLFEFISDNLEADLLDVRYDRDRGYPQSIVVDPAEDVFDDELRILVAEFTGS